MAGGVDKVEVEAEEVVVGINRVARGTRNGGDDGAVLAGNHVDEGGLADIGASDHGDARESVGGVVFAGVEVLDQGIEEVARATAGDTGNGDRIAQAEGIELGEGVHLGTVVDLVGRQHHGLGTLAQHLGHVLVHGGEAFAGVDEEEDDVGLVDGQGDLLADFDLELVVTPHDISAGVDD